MHSPHHRQNLQQPHSTPASSTKQHRPCNQALCTGDSPLVLCWQPAEAQGTKLSLTLIESGQGWGKAGLLLSQTRVMSFSGWPCPRDSCRAELRESRTMGVLLNGIPSYQRPLRVDVKNNLQGLPVVWGLHTFEFGKGTAINWVLR